MKWPAMQTVPITHAPVRGTSTHPQHLGQELLVRDVGSPHLLLLLLCKGTQRGLVSSGNQGA